MGLWVIQTLTDKLPCQSWHGADENFEAAARYAYQTERGAI